MGVVSHHILPFLHGAGGNGKSVMLDVLVQLLGDYATTAPAGFLMTGRSDESAIARLSGQRLVVCSEIDQSARFDEAKVKLITGGDKLTARFLYGQYFSFVPTHHLWLMGNHQPRVEAGGESFWRRLRLVPFNVTVPKPQRIERLAQIMADEEGPGILAWIITGAVTAHRDGLAEPAAVMAATDEYASEEDA
ncbi:phage/plasmid primase, P4 family, partial [Lacticaseibacillus paracasei]